MTAVAWFCSLCIWQKDFQKAVTEVQIPCIPCNSNHACHTKMKVSTRKSWTGSQILLLFSTEAWLEQRKEKKRKKKVIKRNVICRLITKRTTPGWYVLSAWLGTQVYLKQSRFAALRTCKVRPCLFKKLTKIRNCFHHLHRYGDRAPSSIKGRLFAIAWILFGLVVIAVTMAMLTTALTSVTLKSAAKIYGSKVSTEGPYFFFFCHMGLV